MVRTDKLWNFWVPPSFFIIRINYQWHILGWEMSVLACDLSDAVIFTTSLYSINVEFRHGEGEFSQGLQLSYMVPVR